MDNNNDMTRHEALKRMGTVAMSAALATSGFASVSELTTDKRNMKIVAINGSSRKYGNAYLCLRYVNAAKALMTTAKPNNAAYW